MAKKQVLQQASGLQSTLNSIMPDLVDFDAKDKETGEYVYAPKEGYVEIAPVNVKKHISPSYSFKTYSDPVSGITFGIPQKMDAETGLPIHKSIRITGPKQYNLGNPLERKEFIMIKYWPSCIGSPFQHGKPKCKVIDREQEALNEIQKERDADRAKRIVWALVDSPERENELISFSRLLGIAPERESLNSVKRLMLQASKNDPNYLISMWDNVSQRAALEAIRRGISAGIISYDPVGGYQMNGQGLGSSEAAVIDYFITNKESLMTLDMESKHKDKFYKKELDAVEKKDYEDPEVKPKETTDTGGGPNLQSDSEIEAQNKEKAAKLPDQFTSTGGDGSTENNTPEMNKLQEIATKKSYPSEEWSAFTSISVMRDYLTAKASGDYVKEAFAGMGQ